MVVTNLPQGRRASFTASPPTPTRSITSLASHASSKWPHTPDNELGPSFAEISGPLYADDYAASSSYPSHHHHSSSINNNNDADLTIVQLQSPPAWQASSAIPTIPSPKLKSSNVGATEPTQQQQHWMMMTQIRDGVVVVKRSDPAADANASSANANANNVNNAMGAAVSDERRRRPSSVARSFSLDNILSPVPSVPGSPIGKMSVGGSTPPRAVTVDGDDVDDVDMDVEMEDVSPPPPTTTTTATTATPPPTTAIATTTATATDAATDTAISVQPEDIRIPFVATPEREMSVSSERPLQPRSRRRSKAMKIVESDEETEGEREREREKGKEKEKAKPVRWRQMARKTAREGNMLYSPAENKWIYSPLYSHPKLTIKIRPLISPSSSASASAASRFSASSLGIRKSSLSSVTVAEVSEEKERKEGQGQGRLFGKDESFSFGVGKLTSASAPVPGLIPNTANSTSPPASTSASEVPLTPSEQQELSLSLSDATSLPPLIPGKARKRKAPPARKGWKGWVEVEVDESQSQRPVKGFSLDDLPLGERRTRSGKQFDG